MRLAALTATLVVARGTAAVEGLQKETAAAVAAVAAVGSRCIMGCCTAAHKASGCFWLKLATVALSQQQCGYLVFLQ